MCKYCCNYFYCYLLPPYFVAWVKIGIQKSVNYVCVWEFNSTMWSIKLVFYLTLYIYIYIYLWNDVNHVFLKCQLHEHIGKRIILGHKYYNFSICVSNNMTRFCMYKIALANIHKRLGEWKIDINIHLSCPKSSST